MALMISGVPNVTDQGFTNADNAAALEKKFFPLEQVLQQAHHLFRKEYLRMWEMITARINLKKGKKYDFRDIDVILMDLMMPELNGIQATKLIRSMNRADASTIPIIAMTANAFKEDMEMSREAGMNEHLAKPLDSQKIIITIAKYIKK